MLESYSLTSSPTTTTKVAPIKLTNPFNMKDLIYLPVMPAGATFDKKAVTFFNYTLSDDFLIAGQPFLSSIDVWADKVSIKSIKATFENGNSTVSTLTYGLTKQADLSKLTKSSKKFKKDLQISGSNSNYLKATAPLKEVEGAQFALYNFGINQELNLGLSNSSVPPIQALRVS
jgi:hypothetical protein